MDLNYTAEDQAFRATVRAWFEENLPREPLRTLEDRRAWHRKLYEAGFIGMGWPKAYGGQEARPMEQAIVGEEMARVNAPAGVGGLGISIVGPTIIHHGTEEQKKRFVKNILTGEEIWCQLYSEPNSGSDLASLQCRADIDGDEFVINGQKIWNSGAHISDWGLMLARTDRNASKHQGISCILIDMNAPGVEVRPLKQISGSSEFSEVFFSDVRVPADNLLGDEGRGLHQTLEVLDGGRVGIAALCVGLGQAAIDAAGSYAKERRAFGKRLVEHEGVQFKLADMATRLEAARRMTYYAAWCKDQGRNYTQEAAIAKLFASEASEFIAREAIQIHGGYGYSTEFPVERIYRDQRLMSIGEGANEILRLVIAGRLAAD